jgi:hypothetical protein
MNVQVVRSVSDPSHGVLAAHSIQNACESARLSSGRVLLCFLTRSGLCADVELTQAANHYIY